MFDNYFLMIWSIARRHVFLSLVIVLMDRSNLIVNYLPSGFSETDLEELFKPHGQIVSVKVF
jgi:hypothetical protein